MPQEDRAFFDEPDYDHENFLKKLRSKDLNDVKIGVLGQAPAYPVPSLVFVFVSSSAG